MRMQEEMEAAIESASQQTAQDLHLLLEGSRPPQPPADATPGPLGKENMLTPAPGHGKKSSRTALGGMQPGTSAQGILSVDPCSLPNHCRGSGLICTTLLWAVLVNQSMID